MYCTALKPLRSIERMRRFQDFDEFDGPGFGEDDEDEVEGDGKKRLPAEMRCFDTARIMIK